LLLKLILFSKLYDIKFISVVEDNSYIIIHPRYNRIDPSVPKIKYFTAEVTPPNDLSLAANIYNVKLNPSKHTINNAKLFIFTNDQPKQQTN
jgi:hypothetical protein